MTDPAAPALSVSSRAACVVVRASARLHMGFMDLHGGLGRRFGSLGLALEQPSTELSVRPSDAFHASGPSAERALGYAAGLMSAAEVPGGVTLTVERAIPPHSGLGSGTQLALAAGLGISTLYGLGMTAREVAGILDRGARSGIGIGAFEQGGFLVDGGRSREGGPPPLVSRLRFPDAWRVVLVFDENRQGVHGSAEQEAFRTLPVFPEEQSARLCRLVVMRALPALAEGDLATFGAAITELQKCVGDHFSVVQGGRYRSPRVEAALEWLLANGAAGIGQSSWGPTGFALCADENAARRLVAEMGREGRPGTGVRLEICRARNVACEPQVRSAGRRG